MTVVQKSGCKEKLVSQQPLDLPTSFVAVLKVLYELEGQLGQVNDRIDRNDKIK